MLSGLKLFPIKIILLDLQFSVFWVRRSNGLELEEVIGIVCKVYLDVQISYMLKKTIGPLRGFYV